jgi:hypothetical protein
MTDTGPDVPESAWGDWRRRWRDPITLFTLFLVVVGALQWRTLEKTDETLKVQQRAWLTPIAATLLSPPEKDAGINFLILFTNSGREPATGVKVKIKNSTIDSYDARFTNMPDIVVPKNDACDSFESDPGRSVIPPTPIGTGVGITENSIHGEPRLVADDRIVNGAKFYVVTGCAAYSTQEKTRHSSFCYVLYSEIPKSPANQQPAQPQSSGPVQPLPSPLPTLSAGTASPIPQARAFSFQSCAAGFDAS